MSLFCSPPDSSSGIALGLSGYLDCQARVLGEAGFQALAGGPLGASLLSGLLTIFIGFIGYRFILGETPGIRDGVGWAVRLGFVLALVTSWPAFQTLVYRVVTDGPTELAGIMLPASGLPSDGLDARVQQAYDTIRLGSSFAPALPTSAPDPSAAAAASTPTLPPPLRFQPPMPQTASLFVLTTAGVVGAFRIAVGFLLAVAPLAIMALLFDATLGIFSGWIRAVAGMALAGLAAVVVAAIELVVVESELARLEALRFGGGTIDPQALTTVVIVFGLVILVTSLAAMRMMSAFRMPGARAAREAATGSHSSASWQQAHGMLSPAQRTIGSAGQASAPTRASAIAESLAATVRREQAYAIPATVIGGPGGPSANEARDGPAYGSVPGLGTLGRRTVRRHTRAAARRDRVG